jgi:hypothetical protein
MASDPLFTNAQVKWLEDLYPPQCYTGRGSLEEHLMVAGKVELIALMRSRVIDQPLDKQVGGLAVDKTEEEDWLDAQAEAVAGRQQDGLPEE